MREKKHTRFAWIQTAWLISAIALLLGGILAVFTNSDELLEIAVPLGVVMLFCGIVNICIYWRKQTDLHGARWLLADGMTTALLSVFLLFNKMILPAMIPFFFGVWELFSGVIKVVDSRELKAEEIHGWQRFTVIGTLEILSGVAALLKPIEDFMGMNIVVGIVLLIQSLGYLFKIITYPDLKNDSNNH